MKQAYKNIIKSGVICISLILAQAAYAETLSSIDIAHMSTETKMQAQKYFRAHSFDFSNTFSRYHPGPYWILHHKDAFQLTTEQVKQEESLKMGMARSTLEGVAALKLKYDKYASDSKKLNLSIEELMSDVDAIGIAQTRLAKEMIPYHIKGYALLNPAQMKIYQKLVSEPKK